MRCKHCGKEIAEFVNSGIMGGYYFHLNPYRMASDHVAEPHTDKEMISRLLNKYYAKEYIR